MIEVRYAPDLIEQAVWLAIRRDAVAENRMHRAVDPIFEQPEGDNREKQFQAVFVEWFTRLGLDRFLDEMLAHFPPIVEEVGRAIARSASGRKSEGAELFVRDENDRPGRTLVIQVCPESLVQPQRIRDMMLRELQHVEDMLDDSFAYEPESIDGLPSRQLGVRDRYRVLWDMRVEAKLVRRSVLTQSCEPRLRRHFQQAFTIGEEQPRPEVFDQIWNRTSVSHSELFSWASNPRTLLKKRPEHEVGRPSQALGEPCPVCEFPTFDWYEYRPGTEEATARAVNQSVPHWRPEQGICRQCAETFLSISVAASRA